MFCQILYIKFWFDPIVRNNPMCINIFLDNPISSVFAEKMQKFNTWNSSSRHCPIFFDHRTIHDEPPEKTASNLRSVHI